MLLFNRDWYLAGLVAAVCGNADVGIPRHALHCHCGSTYDTDILIRNRVGAFLDDHSRAGGSCNVVLAILLGRYFGVGGVSLALVIVITPRTIYLFGRIRANCHLIRCPC